MPTTLHLIRHGSYPPLGRYLAGRVHDLPLDPEGRAQAAQVAEALAARPLAAVVASPRLRTRETAAPIAAAHGLAVTLDDDLDELAFGDWTGRSFAELSGDPAWAAFNASRALAPIPGGETMAAVQARAVAALLRLRAAYPEGEVAVVSHGDVIKAMLLGVLGAPLELMRRIEVAPASRSVVVLHEADACVLAVNLLP